MKRFGTSIVLLPLALCACVSVGPDYKRPQFDAPQNWGETARPVETAAGIEQAAWWKNLGDPVLDSLVERAVAKNLDVAQARARIAQARAEVVVVRAGALPALNAAGSTTSSYADGSVLSSTPDTSSNATVSPSTTYQGGLGVSWEIDVFGGQRRQREASRAALDASTEDFNATVLTLLGDVAKNYVELRTYQERLAIARASTKSQQENVAVTLERFKIGLISHLDVSQAQAQKSSTEADMPVLEASIKQSIHRLGILLGQEPNALKSELETVRAVPAASGVNALGLPSELLSRRPDLRKAERQLAVASANIGVAAAEQYPKFDLTMGLGLQGNVLTKFLGLANWYWSVVPAFSAPVIDAGKARAGVAKKRAVYDESLAKYHATFLTALEDVENALSAYGADEERKQSLQQAVLASEDALALARERYAKGLTSFLDVLSAEKTLYEAQENHCKSSAAVILDIITLYKALGGGWDCQEIKAVTPAA
ncbi:MAG: efflux transporter outer membrane subunit [Desulfovibrio sp.]|nr:efflux transporter outer membrane subunit [Desulfovibrio sp.]MBI4958570.1 efflux transporter outer membrane subunit [Desulfovibrio sp.]